MPLIWEAGHCIDLSGYRVEATDGHIGRVDRHSDYVDEKHIVVDTGVWVFGKEISLPMSAVTAVDEDGRTVSLSLSKAEVKQAYHEQTANWFGRGTTGAGAGTDPASADGDNGADGEGTGRTAG